MARFKRRPLFSLVCLATVALMSGCEKPLDSPEYGDIIYQVPPELNRSIPLPELDEPSDSPLPGPESPVGPEPPAATTDDSSENSPAANEPAK